MANALRFNNINLHAVGNYVSFISNEETVSSCKLNLANTSFFHGNLENVGNT